MSYTFDGQPMGTLTGDIAAQFLGGWNFAHVGFGAATGRVSDAQSVRNVTVTATLEGQTPALLANLKATPTAILDDFHRDDPPQGGAAAGELSPSRPSIGAQHRLPAGLTLKAPAAQRVLAETGSQPSGNRMLRHCFATTERSPKKFGQFQRFSLTTIQLIARSAWLPLKTMELTFDGQPMGTPLCLSRSPSTLAPRAGGAQRRRMQQFAVERVATMTTMSPWTSCCTRRRTWSRAGQAELGDIEQVRARKTACGSCWFNAVA